jgi:NAD(P)-dependent dehydrogenase (short-subunit alcohol dehydrogenase family)
VTRGILIAGNESSLFSALGAEAAKRVKSFAVAPIPHGSGGRRAEDGPENAAEIGGNAERKGNPERGKAAESGDPALRLDWNPGSPVSGRTLVLAAQSRLERIDDALLVCVPPAYRRPPEELAPAEIDLLIDYNIKGWFFLVRELAGVFKKRARENAGAAGGTLAMILKDLGAGSRDDLPDLVGPAIASAFKSFAQDMLISTLNAPYAVMGFSSREPGDENAFAAHIFKTMEDGRHAGKWHKYGRQGFFGR